jgi:hypothetical protein
VDALLPALALAALAVVASGWAMARAWPGCLVAWSLAMPAAGACATLAVLRPPTPLALLGAVAAGLVLLLVAVLAATAGVAPRHGPLVQLLLLALPVAWPPLLDQRAADLAAGAAELALVVHLARRLGALEGARDAAALCLFVLPATLLRSAGAGDVIVLAVVAAGLLLRGGDTRRALRLLGAVLTATALALLVRWTAGQVVGTGGAGLAVSALPPLGTLLLIGPAPLVLFRAGLGAARSVPSRAALVAAGLAAAVLMVLATTGAGEGAPFLIPLAAIAAVVVALGWPRGRAAQAAVVAGVLGWAAWMAAPRLRGGSGGSGAAAQLLEVDLHLAQRGLPLAGAHHGDVLHELHLDARALPQVVPQLP